MRALVTGGAGFLGSCLVDSLLAAGLEVDAMDDLSQGHMDNLCNGIKNKKFRFILGSILDFNPLKTLVEKADIVFHLAALVGMRNMMAAKGDSLRINAKGAYNVLNACAEGQKRVIVFSSSEVYGDGADGAFNEAKPLDPGKRGTPRWYYAVGKICAEKSAAIHHARSKLPVTVVRPFNATGVRQSASGGMVVPNFVRSAIRGEPIRVFGTGRQRRTFVAAEDLIKQVIRISTDERTIGQTINVGGKEEFSIMELARTVKRIIRSKSPIVNISYKQALGEDYTDISFRRPNLSLLESLGHCSSFKPISDVICEMGSVKQTIA